jgi:hypothetical protein
MPNDKGQGKTTKNGDKKRRQKTAKKAARQFATIPCALLAGAPLVKRSQDDTFSRRSSHPMPFFSS